MIHFSKNINIETKRAHSILNLFHILPMARSTKMMEFQKKKEKKKNPKIWRSII